MGAAPSPLQELTGVVDAATYFESSSTFDLADGRTVTARVFGHRTGAAWIGYLQAVGACKGASSAPDHEMRNSVGELLARMAARYPAAVLRPGSVEIKIAKGSATPAKLTPVMVQAWHEAYGRPVPSLDDLAKARKAEKAARKSASGDALRLLATGLNGVKAFNKLSPEERAKLSLKKAGLSKLKLDGITFGGVNLDEADFSGASLVRAVFWNIAPTYHTSRLSKAKFIGANLTHANLNGCTCTEADFSDSNLTGANFGGSRLLRAIFRGANLTSAVFRHAHLAGADFTNAVVDKAVFHDASFDEQTRWPKGVKPPPSLLWKGEGPDPRLAPSKHERTRPKPTDFAGFLKRLEKVADKAKLAKAMAMLKADRFRLFAKVEDQQVVGVVKSQSDPTLVYSCRLGADGKYACCTQNLNVCGGLRGSPCKHLLVLVLGLTRAGELDPGTAHEWTQASRGQKAELDKDAMALTFLRYKGAEAGEVDWRPTETIPEDFYAM